MLLFLWILGKKFEKTLDFYYIPVYNNRCKEEHRKGMGEMTKAEMMGKQKKSTLGGISMRNSENLPSNYWEPTPDAEDYERMEREVEEGLREPAWPGEPIPFE